MSTTPQSAPITSSLTISNGVSTVTLVAGSVEAAASLAAAISGNTVAEAAVPLVSQLFNTALAKYENGAMITIDDAAIAALLLTDDILEPTDVPQIETPPVAAAAPAVPQIGSAPLHQVLQVKPIVIPDPTPTNTPAPEVPAVAAPAAPAPPAADPAAPAAEPAPMPPLHIFT